MLRTPDEQLQNSGRQIDSLFRQPVMHASAICFLAFGGDDTCRLKLLQPVRQNVGGDSLARILEILKTVEAPHHHVANDQQRPAIAERFQSDAYWTAGAPL